LGSTEAVMTTLLATHGLSVGDSIFVTLACRLVTLWLAVCLGWVAVLLLRQRSLAVAAPWQ
jgi:glycosyltransferase 2 family protein